MIRMMALAGVTALAACVPATDDMTAAPALTAEVAVARGVPPPQVTPGICYARDATPPDGAFDAAREDAATGAPLWFEIPCQGESDRDFIASVQRALAARGYHDGPVTGELDGNTRAAIADYQRSFGLESGILSLAAAQTLGLSLWDPPDTLGGGAP